MNSLKAIFFSVLFSLTMPAGATNWYVATYGSDTNSGTLVSPFKTIEKAVSMAKAGEIIFVKGGTYNLTATISLLKSGTSDAYYAIYAVPGEIPVLDFSAQALDGNNRGIKITGNYWHIKGLHITGAGDNGMKIEGGSYNIIENCSFYRNRDSGLQLDNGASNNTVRNCDSYYNADPTDYGDADGFAPKLTVGSGNYFYGCRAWRNCDDGWDGYMRGADDVSTTLENCWAFENGYFEDGSDAGVNANGNGFKMGGSDDKTLKHNFTLKNCLAFKNKGKGFDQNNNKGSMILYNCTGHNNIVADYRITQTLAAGKVLIVKNSVDLGKTPELGSFAVQEKNGWMSPFVTTGADFLSIDESPAYGPRKANGDLPDIDYMHLASGSDLIDAGVDVGLPYAGTLPDLGCFESGVTGIENPSLIRGVKIYPNPMTDRGLVEFILETESRCEISVYDLTGRLIETIDGNHLSPGKHQIPFSASGLGEGVYIFRIRLDNIEAATVKILKYR